MKSSIVAFSGLAGSGKTSLVRGVTAALGDASAIFADAYRSIEVGAPNYRGLGLTDEQMIERWFAEGARTDDYSSWPLLVEHLKELKAGRDITMPEKMWGSPGSDGVGTAGGEHHVRPARWIVLEDTWFSRSEMRGLVDLSFFVKVPLDVAFARRLVRDVQQGENILGVARDYLGIGHRYARCVKQLASTADVVLDGMRPLNELTQYATAIIRERL